MKKSMEFLVQFKFVWGLFYAASIVFYTIINSVLGRTYMEFKVVWQLFLLSIVIVIIQYLIFGEFLLSKLSLKQKIFIHFPLCYLTILTFLYIFGWTDLSNLTSIKYYTAIYLFLYFAIINSLYMYYKATGEELNSKLAIYKEKKNMNKK